MGTDQTTYDVDHTTYNDICICTCMCIYIYMYMHVYIYIYIMHYNAVADGFRR